MQEFISLADKYNVLLAVYPSSGLGSDLERLKEFYKRFNFSESNGLYLIRQPK
ncbi:MAG: hypothetical protein ABIP51_16780 [Bacteroidia bacterium]